MTEPVCIQCQNLFLAHKADPWWRYLCIASPKLPIYNAVLGEKIADPPYYYAKDINRHGDCKLFSPGVNDYMPKRMPE